MEDNNDSNIDDALGNIKRNRERRLSGKLNAIPFMNKPGLSSIIPGIMQARYYLIAAPQKAGKTSLADDLFLIGASEWVQNNLESGISLKIFYFTLEMSKMQKLYSVISQILFVKHNIIISTEDLLSQFEGDENIISEDEIAKVEEIIPYVKNLLKNVEFIENTRNPYGIYKTVRTYMESVGTYTFKTIDFDDGKGPQQVRDQYTKNDEDHYVIMITDHLALLSPEKGQSTIKEAIGKFSSKDCIELRNKFGVSVVNVQQMSAASQSKEYHQGKAISDKLKPVPAHLGEDKTTSRDCCVMISLFNPYIYGLLDNNGYDVLGTRDGLRDNYRELIINLNRYGQANKSIDMFFNGAIGKFNELPPPDNGAQMAQVKEFVNRLKRKR